MNESVQRGLKLLNPGSVVPVDVKTVADLYNALDYTVKQAEKFEWVGLTDEEINSCCDFPLNALGMKHVRKIEAKLRSKNT